MKLSCFLGILVLPLTFAPHSSEAQSRSAVHVKQASRSRTSLLAHAFCRDRSTFQISKGEIHITPCVEVELRPWDSTYAFKIPEIQSEYLSQFNGVWKEARVKRFEDKYSHVQLLQGFSLGGVIGPSKGSDTAPDYYTKYELQFIFTEPLSEASCRVNVQMYSRAYKKEYTSLGSLSSNYKRLIERPVGKPVTQPLFEGSCSEVYVPSR